MDARELLRQAADDIERYGWMQDGWVPGDLTTMDGSPKVRDCPACAGGALALAASGGKFFSPSFVNSSEMKEAFVLLAEYLGLEDSEGRMYEALDLVVEWNDSPGRTQAEVVAALRGAAGGRSFTMLETKGGPHVYEVYGLAPKEND